MDKQTAQIPPQQTATVQNVPHGILDKTMAEILKENPQAQSLIMKSMNISTEQFQKMLASTQQNDLMHMKVRELFSKGIVQQALSQQGKQVSPEQAAALQTQGVVVTQQETEVPQEKSATAAPRKTSFVDSLKSWFK